MPLTQAQVDALYNPPQQPDWIAEVEAKVRAARVPLGVRELLLGRLEYARGGWQDAREGWLADVTLSRRLDDIEAALNAAQVQ